MIETSTKSARATLERLLVLPGKAVTPSGARSVRVLHITNDFRNNGTGITNLVRTLVLEQLAGGAMVEIMSEVERSDYVDELRQLGAVFSVIPRLSSVDSIVTTARRIARSEADIIHVHTARAALATALAGRRSRLRSVATVHNIFQRSSLLMTLCARVVCISSDVERRIVRMAPFTRGRTRVVYNAARRDEESTRIDLHPQSIVYVGGLHHRKGVDLLISYFEALAPRHPAAHLFIVGNRDSPEIEARVRESPVRSAISLEGFSPDPRPFMRGATVVAVPSRDEPFGLVALEARLSGTAIVASDIGGLREALDDGRAGDLVPVGDIEAWSLALGRVLDDEAYRETLADRGRQNLERFTPEGMAHGYARVYEEILDRRAGSGR